MAGRILKQRSQAARPEPKTRLGDGDIEASLATVANEKRRVWRPGLHWAAISTIKPACEPS